MGGRCMSRRPDERRQSVSATGKEETCLWSYAIRTNWSSTQRDVLDMKQRDRQICFCHRCPPFGLRKISCSGISTKMSRDSGLTCSWERASHQRHFLSAPRLSGYSYFPDRVPTKPHRHQSQTASTPSQHPQHLSLPSSAYRILGNPYSSKLPHNAYCPDSVDTASTIVQT